MKTTNKKRKNAHKTIATAVVATVAAQAGAPAVYALQQEVEAKVAHKSLKVSVLSDPHYYPEEYVPEANREEFKKYMEQELYLLEESAGIFKAALEKVAKDDPDTDILLIPGDMTKNNEKIGYKQIQQILTDFETETGIEVFVTAGNHDVNTGGFKFTEDGKKVSLTEDELATVDEYYTFMKEFGYDSSKHQTEFFQSSSNKDEDSLSYVSRPKEGFVILSLNSNTYKYDENGNATDQGNPGFSEELIDWAVAQIEKAKKNGETVIAMSHHALIPHSTVNSLSSSAIIANWEAVSTRLADAGLRYVFTGHMHENDVAEYTTIKGNTLYDIETGATAGYGSPVRSVEFQKGKPVTNNSNETIETVKISSESVKSATVKGKKIDDLQDYIYDSMYKDSVYLEKKLGGMLYPLVDKLAELNLSDLIFGNDGSAVSKKFSTELKKSFGKQIDGNKINKTKNGTISFKYDEKTNTVKVTSTDGKADSVIDIEGFIRKIVARIDEKILDKDVLRAEIDNIITAILNVEVYNANTPEKKVIRDVVNLFLIDHFLGAEDLSGWPQEVLDQFKTGEGVEEVIDDLVDSLLSLVPSLLGKVEVKASDLTDDKILQMAINIALGKDKTLNGVLKLLGVDLVQVIKEPIDGLLDDYVTPSFTRQFGTLISNLLYGLVGDESQDDEIDGESITLKYNGSLKPQTPSIDNGLLPHSVAVTFGEDETTEKAFSWYTGKDVPKNEIQYVKASDAVKDAKGNIDFTSAQKVSANSEIVKRSFPTVDLGLIAISKDKDVARHQTVIENLEPGTKYYYRVGNSDSGVFTDVATFETAKVNDENFSFLAFGDTQAMLEDEYEGWGTIVELAKKRYPNAKFATHSGDMTDNGKNELQWQWFLNKAQDELMDTTMITASGNHEGGAPNSQVNHFNIDDLPAQDTKTGAYYKVDYGNTLMLTLNTENLENNKLSQAQVDWLKKTANESDATWKIINLHKSTYSNGSHYKDEDVVAIREQLDSIVTELGIDVVIGGHDHTYARSEFLVNGEVEKVQKVQTQKDGITYETAVKPEGTMYLTVGSTGPKFYDPKETGLPLAYAPDIQTEMYTGITVEDDTLYYNAYTVDLDTKEEKLIDSYAITKETKEEEVVGKDELNSLIQKAEKIDTSAYTEESVSSFTKALEDAKTVVANEAATQDNIDDAIHSLQTAMDNLEEKVQTPNPNPNPSPNPDVEETKLVGDNRYQTATKIAQQGWNKANEVVLVNSSAIVDALSATPYAEQQDAPILLADKDKLNEETKKEIERLKANKVTIIGGENSVSSKVVSELEAMGIAVERISGETRYETSINIAKKLDDVSEIVVVNGEKGLADAVSIAAVAAQKDMPILLTSSKDISNDTKTFIKEKSVSKTYVIGGENSVSNEILEQLPNAERISGADRNETNAAVMQKFTSYELNNVFVAKDGKTGEDHLVDALAVGVLAAKENGVVVLADKDKLNEKQELVLSSKNTNKVTQIGGNGNETVFEKILNIFRKN